MSLDWTHQFCLACDRQTDGATYCSESCRLADYEKTSTSSTGPSSPTFTGPSFDWTLPNPTVGRPLRLTPAYDFRSIQHYRASQRNAPSSQVASQKPTASNNQFLSPSNSHTSLCSMKSNSSADSTQLTEKATRELQAYARSFESVRLQRRRSY